MMNIEHGMGSQITLKELAKLLHLAPSTVSRALKKHPDISLATRDRVMEAARRLHYRPDAVARGLRQKNSYTIAILVPELTDNFYARVVSRVISSAKLKEYKVVVFENHADEQEETDICHFLEKSGITGLLVAPVAHSSDVHHFSVLQEAGMPVVVFRRMIGDWDTDRVAGDYYKGAYDAVSYMIESGCRKVAHLAGPADQIWSQKKRLGYTQAILEHHLEMDTALIADYCPDRLENIIRKWIKQMDVDGIFALNDYVALNAMKVLREMNYSIPEQVAVCGYGNYPAGEYSCPALTTVDGAAEEIAQCAWELLWKNISGQKENTETYLLKNKLLIRDSTK